MSSSADQPVKLSALGLHHPSRARVREERAALGFGDPTLMELGIHDRSIWKTVVVDCCLGREFGECLCDACLKWQKRSVALARRSLIDARCCAPDARTLYISRHTDVLCLIKGTISHEFPDDDGSDMEWSEDEVVDERERELYVQLEHERGHARNMQPGLRWMGTGGQDPDSVICWF
jgi:hypothetical protein